MGSISSKEWVIEESEVGLTELGVSLLALVTASSTIISLWRSSHNITDLELGDLGTNLSDNSDNFVSWATRESLISRPLASSVKMIRGTQSSESNLSSDISLIQFWEFEWILDKFSLRSF